MIFKIGPNFEEIFDRMRTPRVSNTIRNIKEFVTGPREYDEQKGWINEMSSLIRYRHVWMQRYLFLKEEVIKCATRGKLEEIHTLESHGSKHWRHKLEDLGYIRCPDGATVRQYRQYSFRSSWGLLCKSMPVLPETTHVLTRRFTMPTACLHAGAVSAAVDMFILTRNMARALAGFLGLRIGLLLLKSRMVELWFCKPCIAEGKPCCWHLV
ncbi:conserved hypothetical protein [Microsporum canis CBS 113480]|uniref:Uncharacterized protein n=1 Tax=Arthroderma otae (strain ATCC MYA-4605 / CBS 113480) TaxID=554155 RepID=C5FDE0_ARTOC|nr:conserved hypothetical protein [Microsporum canis CBS 113480]EEQ27914.1 conserved hypothetical protein [Microsporum canis CBS 113480]